MNDTLRILARRARPVELGGLLGNQLDVPPGQQAVVLSPQGAVQVLPAGRQTVPGVSLFGPKPQMYLVPAGEFSLMCGAPYLATGDKARVDAAFTATLRVSNPGVLAAQWLAARETLSDQDVIARITALAQPHLAGLVKAYAAADLCGPTPVAERVLGELRGRLAAPLAETGLELVGLRYPAFTPAQEPAAQVLAIETLQAEVRQAAPTPQAVQAAAQKAEQLGVPAPLAREQSRLEQILDEKLSSLAGQLLGRLEARLQPQAKTAEPPPNPESEWWDRFSKICRVLSVLFILATALVRLFMPVSTEQEQAIRQISEILGITATLSAAVAAIYAHTRASQKRIIEIKPTPLLNRVSQRDRQAADRLVREQLVNELLQIARTVKQARERVYTSGREKQALSLGDVVRSVEKFQLEVATPTEGVPPYLARPSVSLQELGAMLDYDEDLLLEANSLSDTAQALLQTAINDGDVTAQARETASSLAQLQHRFAARARFLQGSRRGDKEASRQVDKGTR